MFLNIFGREYTHRREIRNEVDVFCKERQLSVIPMVDWHGTGVIVK